MNTFETFKRRMLSELLELERLNGLWPSTTEKRRVKEREIGRQCYLAEETLDSLELSALKDLLGVNDRQWRAYKARVLEGGSGRERT